MRKEQIINFDGMKFGSGRRSRMPRNKRWQVRRQAKNRVGVARNLRGVFTHLFGL